MSSLDITWNEDFYGIAWAYEKGRLVISTIFEDRKKALDMASQVDEWSDKFTRLTIIENDKGEFALCCYQDPQISKNSVNIGLYRFGMIQNAGYLQAKPMIEEKSPLLQIAYAANVSDMSTYEQISRLVPIRKCRIIKESDLKKQEFFYEKTAHNSKS